MGRDLKDKNLGKGITQQANKKYRVRFRVKEVLQLTSLKIFQKRGKKTG